MRDKIVATRYAEAYVRFASPAIGMPRVIEDMRITHWALREAPRLREFLRAPEVSHADKFAFLDKVFGGALAVETCDFIKYLISKRRIDNLVDIAHYIRIVYSHGEVVDVVLRSTFPLELDLVERVKDVLAKRVGRKVNLYFELDPDLLGGIRITLGNRIIDASVRNMLHDLRNQLLKAQVAR
ncbi:MAG: ATP synthase F1 subunit delta [Candidatus Omnitrophica bacterium]|nr:ATP synthase F1 subunit delta [Candidatus Omnitrophota bacterium]